MLLPELAAALNLAGGIPQGRATAPRIPIIFRCSSWVRQGIPPVIMAVNPQNVSFRQTKRVTKKNTAGGTVYFHWTDENGQNNDVLEMQCKGVTGSILNRADRDTSNAATRALGALASAIAGGPQAQPGTPNMGRTKHLVWARLYSLTRTPMIDPDTKEPNVFECFYRSPLFPAPVLFQGFFNNVLEFGEDAKDPWLVPWSFSFIVQRTNPSLDVISQYLSNALTNPGNLDQQLAAQGPNTVAAQIAQKSAASNTTNQG
jgi:hypothetical protein